MQDIRNYGYLFLLLVLILAGCEAAQESDDDDDKTARFAIPTPKAYSVCYTEANRFMEPKGASTAYTMQLLHAADFEGNVDTVGNAPRFSQILNAFKEDYRNTLVLSSGDNYIAGPFMVASADDSMEEILGDTEKALGDIQMINAMGFQASAVGNHEFDDGTGLFEDLIPQTTFPYLSANLDYTNASGLASLVAEDGQEAGSVSGKLAKSTIITVNGEKIGIVGATTPTLEQIANVGGVTVNPAGDANAALAAIIQESVDALTAQGINKIVLLAHMQLISVECGLAELLKDVDIIVAGGSDTILTDSQDNLRADDASQGDYPIWVNSASNEPVAIVNTDGQYRYVGRFVIDFDPIGRLIPTSYNPSVGGAYPTDEDGVARVAADATPNETVVKIAAGVGEVIKTKDGNTFGKTSVYLNGVRGDVRNEETNLGNLTADANLIYAKQVAGEAAVVSLKNGGGIRAAIGYIDVPPGSNEEGTPKPPAANPLAGKEEGEVSQLDIENSLAFNNRLVALDVTAQVLKELLEHGVARVGETSGRFPQISGVRLSIDPSKEAGSRIINAVLEDGDTLIKDGALQGDASRTIRLVTLSFLAEIGGDGYPFVQQDENGENILDAEDNPIPRYTNFVDLSKKADLTAVLNASGREQDALAWYLKQNFASAPFAEADTALTGDARIQNLTARDDAVVMAPLSRIGTYNSNAGEASSEIVSYDPASKRGFVVNVVSQGIDILDVSDPTAPTFISNFDLTPYGNSANSVSVYDGVVAVAVQATTKQDPGKVVFFKASDATLINEVTVGALPDMLTFTPDGMKIVVANEGEPSADYTNDPEGSISIIDLSGGVAAVSANSVTTADFQAFNTDQEALVTAGVRIFGPNATVAQDLEPEYITVSSDSKTAWVTLQENNALAIVDLTEGKVTSIVPLGLKDHSLAHNAMDASDRDDDINITTHPVWGMYQPDTIDSYTYNGKTYLVTANEGDGREYGDFTDESRVKDLTLDTSVFTNATTLTEDANLGRLTVSTVNADTNSDNLFDKLFAYGARSFSIWDEEGKQVFDSGDDFEQITALAVPELFNSSDGDTDEKDKRSDNKGPEPEAVAVGTIDGKTYAFIGLERVGGIMVYDISNPWLPKFIQYLAGGTDISPEGMKFIPADKSPNGKNLLMVGHEVSGTTSIFQIN